MSRVIIRKNFPPIGELGINRIIAIITGLLLIRLLGWEERYEKLRALVIVKVFLSVYPVDASGILSGHVPPQTRMPPKSYDIRIHIYIYRERIGELK